jgi:flagellar biosynthesis GTPase FlhF
LDKALAINDCFKSVFSRFNRTSESIEAVASLLPCCSSEAQFDQDAATLIGSSPDAEVDKILHRKKEQLQKQEVEKRRSALTELRKKEPENYPAYLDELLGRYMHLYDHLMLMKALSTRLDRASENEKITFSQLSHVVLETREAIIRKVESSIPADCHDVLFLIGGTGAGKSTTLSFLLGEVMELKD